MKLKSLFFLFVIYIICSILLNHPSYANERSRQTNIDNLNQQNESFSFVVWGHPKRGDGYPALHFEEILDRILELKADFLVITGDVINGMYGKSPDPEIIRADWDHFDEGVKKLKIPVYRLPGNHDVSNFITRDIYLEKYNHPPYAFTYGRCRFILLDTIGIDQRKQDGNPNWYPQKLPFDDTQLTFIRNEIIKQDNYNHIFFFMHHVFPYRMPSGFWWRDVHPMLKGGKTRIVFAGTPGNPMYKYDHFEQDNIHYILSCTFPPTSIKRVKEEIIRGDVDHEAMNHQPDNLQFVRVTGNHFTVRTIVVGEWDKKSMLSSRFWLKARQFGWRDRIRVYKHEILNPSVVNFLWLGGGLGVGALVAIFLHRRRLRLREK
jgi:hypothetical protein